MPFEDIAFEKEYPAVDTKLSLVPNEKAKDYSKFFYYMNFL